jgi:hypothetical protein
VHFDIEVLSIDDFGADCVIALSLGLPRCTPGIDGKPFIIFLPNYRIEISSEWDQSAIVAVNLERCCIVEIGT